MTKYINSYVNNAAFTADTNNFSYPHVGYLQAEDEVKYNETPGDFNNFWGTVVNGTTSAPSISINGVAGGEKCDGYYWFVNRNNISRFVFDNSKSSYKTINRLENSTSDGIIHYNNQFNNFKGLFKDMTNLEYVDVSKIDTSAVTTFNELFGGCFKLVEINGVENLNTSGVTTMDNIFYNCRNLTSLNLSNWNTSNVTRLDSAFLQCYKLESLDLSNWDLSKTTSKSALANMFSYAYVISSITMNNTSQATLEAIQTQLVTDSVASHVTIVRDGYNWNYVNGQWTSTPI